jgi:Holliday junction resolvase
MGGSANRRKGHAYERELVKRFKELGWDEAVTSRYASKMMDDMKVDLVNTEPFYVQAKCTKRAPNIRKILEEMPDTSNYNVITWKVPKDNDQYVMMNLDDFFELLEMLKSNKIL